MKTYLKSILAIIMIAFCACEKDPTFEFRSIDDNATKVSSITATSADVTFSIIIAQSGRFSIVNYNYANDYVEVYYSTSSNPFIEPHKCVRKPLGYDYTGTNTVHLSNLEPETTYYYAIKWRKQGGEVRSFTTKSREWVDLGLSVKWATCNVGTTTPENYGDRFAWGETSPKTTYDWSTYKWCNGSHDTQTKYCTSSSYGTVDNKTTLDLSDDAAHVNWGGSWRMPTLAEIQELKANCTWTWTTQNRTKGYLVKSNKNSNSIFLPASGYCHSSSLYNAGSDGNYWSSSLNEYSSDCAFYLEFSSDYVGCVYGSRYYGRSVRPVCP